MFETWRWFGPDDPITLSDIKQTGAKGIVTALHHINRGGAWPAEEVAKRRSEIEAAGLTWSVVESIAVPESVLIEWLPAREFVYDRASFRQMLDLYREIGPADLRAHLIAFLREIVPVAEEEGVRLCVHPDDPSFPIFGLPRVMSSADDMRALFQAVPQRENGLTLCSGSLGSNGSNNLVAMAREFGTRIHFAHLRNVTRESDGSFYEAEHLDGDTDMVALVAALMGQRKRDGSAKDGPMPRSRCGRITATCCSMILASMSIPAIQVLAV